jgi:hypothetical protein
MRRFNTMMACACAAALTTLVVIVTVPAIADNAADANAAKAKGPDPFAACLRDHGLAGAPDDATLKPWLGERLNRGDVVAKRALKTCAPETRERGPSAQELRSCLADHGVAVPGDDADSLKRWMLAHGDDAAYRDAMSACGMAPVVKPTEGGSCGEKGGVPKPVPPEGAGKGSATTAEPAT